jgi:PQQ-dependent dehydrogenase (methanol/ethanol family)
MLVMVRSRKKAWINWLAVVVLGGVFALGVTAQQAQQAKKIDAAALKNSGKTGEEWLNVGLNHAEQRYSPLKQIDATNVSRLGLAWSYDLNSYGGGQEATPLVANGTIYIISNWSLVYAVDARTGKEKWKWDPQVNQDVMRRRICCGFVNRGLGIYNGKIFVPVIDGRLVALDAETGRWVWGVQTTPPDENYSVTIAPRIANGKIILGNAGAEYPVRGYVSAYDTETGGLIWRWYTVPGDPSKGFENEAMRKAADTWGGEWYKMGGGGTVWDGMAYDPDTNLVYFGTGNGGPWPQELRQSKGKDNLYVASIVALNADTGVYKWHYQVVPGDEWDYDSVQQLTLADIRINGRERKVITQANKNGFFYVIDRLTGEFISAEPFAPLNWASGVDPKTGRPIINPGALYGTSPVSVFPGPGGAHNWAPMSYNPITGLMYIPASLTTRGGSIQVNPNFVYNPAPGVTNLGTGGGRGGPGGPGGPGAVPGGPPAAPGAPGVPPAVGGPVPGGLPPGGLPGAGDARGGLGGPGGPGGPGFVAPPAAPPAGPTIGPLPDEGQQNYLLAINPATQKLAWRSVGGGGFGGGTVTTAANLVFQALSSGHLIALSADKGEKLMDIETGQTAGIGPPMTYMIDGKQYVALLAGNGPSPVNPNAPPAGAPGGPGAGGRGGGGTPRPARLYVYTLDGKAATPKP